MYVYIINNKKIVFSIINLICFFSLLMMFTLLILKNPRFRTKILTKLLYIAHVKNINKVHNSHTATDYIMTTALYLR